MSKRHLIGLLTNDLVGTYQYSFWAGMKAAAREEDCDVVSFNGGELGSQDQTKLMRNSVFEFVAQTRPSALVLLAPVVANSSGIAQIETLLHSIGGIPLITAAIEIPGYPSVLVDNASGMDTLIEHLIDAHGRKRFAYVGGPARNPDAQQRRDTFLRVLSRHGIAFDSALEVAGEFDFGISKSGVGALLKDGREFDALVAANDEMALAAMEAIKEFGRRIPDDIVVSGFDDVEDSLHARPALTTVHQPVFEQGQTSVRLCLDRIEGESVAPVTIQSATLVRRGSCGCHSTSVAEAGRLGIAFEAHPSPAGAFASPEHLGAVMEACGPIAGGTRYASSLAELVQAISTECLEGACDKTRSQFEFLVEAASTPDDEYDRWQIFLSRLRATSLPFLPHDASKIATFEDIVHQMRVLIQDRATQDALAQAAQLGRWSRAVHETACHMLEKFDTDHLFRTLAHDAKGLQISTLQFLLREPGLAKGDFRLALSLVRGQLAPLPPRGEVVSFGSAFRAIVKHAPLRSAVVVEPLFFGNEQLGFLLLELVKRRGMLLDSLRGQISATLMGAKMFDAKESVASAPRKAQFALR
jgi:phosphoserine phosphatase RsbU/P